MRDARGDEKKVAGPRDAPPSENETPKKGGLPATVIALGFVSLFTDASADMIYPLVPKFLLSLGGGAIWLGWLEGVAEAVSAFIKVRGGLASDDPARRKPLIGAGYFISALSRPLYALATHPLHAVFVRTLDRVGKGLRGPPRDAMVAGAVPASQRAHAFGFHRMMDNLGGVLGPVIAWALLSGLDVPLRMMFVLSVIPGLLSVLIVALFVRPPAAVPDAPVEAKNTRVTPKAPDAPAGLSPAARRYLIAATIFGLASSGDLFLMRRMTDLGLDVALVPIAWVSLQLGKSLSNIPGGKLADRFGRKRALSVAWALYGLCYAAFGSVGGWKAAWVMLLVYALHYGLSEGTQKALLADYTHSKVRGRAYGAQLALEGGSALVTNLAFGFAYDHVSPSAAFLGTAAMAGLAALVLALFVPKPEPTAVVA